MNQLHLHLILAHLPVIIIPLAALILTYAILKSIDRFTMLALILFIFSSAVTFPLYFTGDSAEESIEDSAQFSESTIEKHEESAETTLWLVSTLGLLSMVSLLLRKFKPNYYNNKVLFFLLLLSLCTATSLALTASRGGEISHPEAFDKKSTGI